MVYYFVTYTIYEHGENNVALAKGDQLVEVDGPMSNFQAGIGLIEDIRNMIENLRPANKGKYIRIDNISKL